MSEELDVLQRVIFPEHGDPQAMPLFLDPQTWSWAYIPDSESDRFSKIRGVFVEGHNRLAMRLTSHNGLAWLNGRRGLRLPKNTAVSLATYFNAFPASYWKTWTTVDRVILRVHTSGHGRVIVFRSNARGVIQQMDGVEATGDNVAEFDIPLVSFLDGGWLWFDLIAGDETFELVQADWLAPQEVQPTMPNGTATVSITTLNRADYCTRLVREIGEDAEVSRRLDQVLVVDQGTEKIVENDGFPAAKAALGEKLRVIEQRNLGGSGGFSRGMLETLNAGRSDYVILLDDDVEIEPESIRRALVFANYGTAPAIIGGHMFDMYAKSTLHAYAEGIRWEPFMWGPFTPGRHNFGESNLRQTTWLHRRYDVDYNGWWMSLIPVSVLKEVGLSLPVFIKWDDAEYSLRARKHGVPTVSLPGAAVWHVSWVDKDDSHDWQAYFHARNRLITALLHSPEPRGGKLWRTYLAADLKNLLTMDYYTVAMHLTAVRSIFAGPQRLHQELPGRLKKIRAMASGFRESKLLSSVEDLPHFPAREIMAVTTGRSDPGPRGLRFAWWLAKQIVRHGFTEPSDDALQKPQAHLAFQDARWFEVPNYESVLISNASGSGATWHVRNPRVFRRMLWQSVMLHWRVHREWNRLRAKYIKALPNITSVEEWAKTLEVNPSAVKAARKQR